MNQDALYLNGTHQLLVYADDVNILKDRVHTIKENLETSIVASKVIVLKVNSVTTEYMVMSRDQNAKRSLNMMIDDRSFALVERINIWEQS